MNRPYPEVRFPFDPRILAERLVAAHTMPVELLAVLGAPQSALSAVLDTVRKDRSPP